MGFDLGNAAQIASSVIGAGSSLLGGVMSSKTAKKIAQMQIDAQKEFAQNGIQWKVTDAKAAGLHPLYALGANTATYTPVSQDSSAMGNAVAEAGAYLGKAVDQAIDGPTKKALEQENLEYARLMREGNLELMRQNIRGKKLDNDFNEQQMVNSLKSQASGNPARPIAVSTPMGEFNIANPDVKRYTSKVARNGASTLAGVSLKPAEVTMASPGNPAQTAGAHSDYSLIRTDDGYVKVPSQEFADRTDDDIFSKIGWHMRNTVGDRTGYIFNNALPTLDKKVYPLPSGLPAGYSDWRYHPIYGGFYPYDAGTRRYWSKSRRDYFY